MHTVAKKAEQQPPATAHHPRQEEERTRRQRRRKGRGGDWARLCVVGRHRQLLPANAQCNPTIAACWLPLSSQLVAPIATSTCAFELTKPTPTKELFFIRARAASLLNCAPVLLYGYTTAKMTEMIFLINFKVIELWKFTIPKKWEPHKQ